MSTSTPGMEQNHKTEAPRDVSGDVIYLCSCAVNGVEAEKARIEQMDLHALYHTAQRHMLTAVVARALAAAGVRNPAFIMAEARTVRQTVLMDTEQEKILDRLEEAGIWYMPLKGAVLKNLYPAFGIREMADRDILIDADRGKDVRSIMLELGYSAGKYEEDYHDCYSRPPVYSFEMHRHLIGPMSGKAIYSYYMDIEQRLQKDTGNAYGYHFSAEDFYVFQVTHEYKHFSERGTGLRSLLDTYVYLKNTELDMDYVGAVVKKLGLEGFEQANRSLAMHLFGNGILTDAEQSMLDYVLSCGTYGKDENIAINLLEREGKKGFFVSRLTLPYARMLELYPFLKKVPVLYPFCWLHRLVHALIFKNATVMSQLKAGLTWKGKPEP